MKICPHAVRALEDWTGMKTMNTKVMSQPTVENPLAKTKDLK
jgi:hypothetical protein